MYRTIKLKKGLDIRLAGVAEARLTKSPMAGRYAVSPADFKGVTPKLLVQEGDQVMAGTPLFFDKNRPELLFTSPVSGRVSAIVRGEKRRIDKVVVEPDAQQRYVEFPVGPLGSVSREQVINILQASGLWACIIQRPYGIIADARDTPKSVFVSGFDSAPLAPDMDFALAGRADDINKGMEVLARLTPGKVHLGLRSADGLVAQTAGVDKTIYKGPHPAGNVGVQIHHTDPVGKGEKVWTVGLQHVAAIGSLFLRGRLDMRKVVALTGSEVTAPRYYSVTSGAPIESIVRKEFNIRPQGPRSSVRIVSGNPLSGSRRAQSDHIGFYDDQLCVLPEGDHHELLGWVMPRLNKFSVSRSYFSWICPRREYVLDTNTNGGHRAFVLSGLYEKYLPMDIYPVYLLKAILAGDIDKMENLGIYEVVEEDLALCEFVDPSKTEMQDIVRQGINLMIKELD